MLMLMWMLTMIGIAFVSDAFAVGIGRAIVSIAIENVGIGKRK